MKEATNLALSVLVGLGTFARADGGCEPDD